MVLKLAPLDRSYRMATGPNYTSPQKAAQSISLNRTHVVHPQGSQIHNLHKNNPLDGAKFAHPTEYLRISTPIGHY